MEKLSLNLRCLLFALCLTGCLQALAVPGKRASRFPDLRTFLKEHFQAHSQSPSREWPAPFAKGLAREKSKGFAPALKSEGHEIVTPPTGLVTEDYTLVSRIRSRDDYDRQKVLDGDHLQTLQIGFDGSDIYIKGMSSIFPDAWIKGTLSEDQRTVKIPTPQYIGSRVGEDGESVDWFFTGYNEYYDYYNNFFINYNNEDGSFSLSLLDEIYESDILFDDWISLYYPQIVKGVLNDNVVTPPSGLTTKDYMLKGNYWNGDTIQIPLKVGFYQDDVYVRGLFPGLPDAWIEGKLFGNEITFPKWQCFGESEEIGQLLAEQYELEEIGRKKLYLFGLDLENYTTGDLVVKYDEVNGTMTGDVMVVGLSRTNLGFTVYVTQGFAITPISEKAAIPSAPDISAFALQDDDFAFSFDIPFMGTEGEGLVTDNLYYRILTENAGNISTVSFNPADYETLQETISLVPYGFSDKKYFTTTYNFNSSEKVNKVILKRSQFASLNKIGVQSVYNGGGVSNESDVSWFTIENAIYQLYREIRIATSYLSDFYKPLGRDDLQSVSEIASDLYNELSSMNEEALQSYNIIYILDAIQSLKTAEKVFLQRNANCDERVIQLSSEIYDAYLMYYDEEMPYGKEELLAAISHAEQLRDEILSLDEEALKEYDMSIVDDEITALQDAKQTYTELNEKWNYITELKSEISNANHLFYEENEYLGLEALFEAINHADELLYTYLCLDEDEQLAFDMYLIQDEIQALKEAEQAFMAINNPIDEEEWQLLRNYYESVDTSYWYQDWDFSSDFPSTAALPGVESYDGHITKIDLTDNNIVGTFPYEFLTLPYLEELILSENNLIGDIGDGITKLIQNGNEVSPSIRYLDISRNQLSGNIGPLANALPGLYYLDASENCLDEVTPVIPKTVWELYLNGQDLQGEVDLHIQDVVTGTLLQSMPNILFYNHEDQEYYSVLSLDIEGEHGETVKITLNDESFEINDTPYAYKGENGGIVYAKNRKWSYRDVAGDISLPIRLYFDEGDADFNGRIDILDLQTQIDYIVNDYNAINFTAANLWMDNTINVQDAVCMVNLLLDRNPSTVNAKHPIRQRERQQADGGSQVFVNGGKLFLNTNLPVAAFEIVVSSDNDVMLSSELKKHGLTCSIRKANGQTHLIGYSISGGTLLEGLNEICSGLDGEVIYAMLASKNAHEIPVDLNLMPTDISRTQIEIDPVDVKYVIPLGTNHAIFIDSNKKKTIHKTTTK